MADTTVGKRLEGKVVIITGGASGIGEATARLFAQHGTRMIIIVDIQDEKGQHVASSIGLNVCNYIHCDVTDDIQVKSMVESTVHNYGRIDILFSNAGIFNPSQTILDLDFSKFDHLLAVNVRGMASCVKHVAKSMVDGGVKGSIVCTTSIRARVAGEAYVDYIMSKHAVLGLVRGASVQLGRFGIRVNCVSPSVVATPMACEACGLDQESVEEKYSCFSSLKGEFLKVRHVADAVLFLASDESAFVTGLDLMVDGGYRPGCVV